MMKSGCVGWFVYLCMLNVHVPVYMARISWCEFEHAYGRQRKTLVSLFTIQVGTLCHLSTLYSRLTGLPASGHSPLSVSCLSLDHWNYWCYNCLWLSFTWVLGVQEDLMLVHQILLLTELFSQQVCGKSLWKGNNRSARWMPSLSFIPHSHGLPWDTALYSGYRNFHHAEWM